MTRQLTMKSVKAHTKYTVAVGYCELQELLNLLGWNKVGYTAGVYGWNADIFSFRNGMIVTGYRPFGNFTAKHDLCERFVTKFNETLKQKPNIDRIGYAEELIEDLIDLVTMDYRLNH